MRLAWANDASVLAEIEVAIAKHSTVLDRPRSPGASLLGGCGLAIVAAR